MLSVLILEDVTFIRLGIKASLAKYDSSITFYEADNLVDAFRVVEGNSIDLILLDLDLGNIKDKCEQADGLMLIQLMQSRGLSIPKIIVVSGNVDPANMVRAMSSGCVNDILSKPYPPEMLIDKIGEVTGFNKIKKIKVEE